MVNRVTDDERKLAAKRGPAAEDCARIRHRRRDAHRFAQRSPGPRLQVVPQPGDLTESGFGVALDLASPLAMLVRQGLPGLGLQERRNVIETVTNVRADRPRGGGDKPRPINLAADVEQQRLQLIKEQCESHGRAYAIPMRRPATGSCERRMKITMALPAKTRRARPNSRPPSPWTSMPRIRMWLAMAPAMTPIASSAPSGAVDGINSRIEAISSTTPEPMRPQGSTAGRCR